MNAPGVNAFGDRVDFREAQEAGRICVAAVTCQRDLCDVKAKYPDLFPDKPFDPALFSAIAQAMAFSAPLCPAAELRLATRSVLWGFAADWQVDYQAQSLTDIEAITAGCLAVADGEAPVPENPLSGFLSEVCDDLATVPAFRPLRAKWREELRRMLAGMAREWEWKAARNASSGAILPTFAEYLANADNLGASFVNLSHWIFTSGPEALDHFDQLSVISGHAQRVLRLVNDLATYERDVQWGDLNALMLVDRDEVNRHVTDLMQHLRDQVRPLEDSCPQETSYLIRQVSFASGFYQLTDFWGEL